MFAFLPKKTAGVTSTGGQMKIHLGANANDSKGPALRSPHRINPVQVNSGPQNHHAPNSLR